MYVNKKVILIIFFVFGIKTLYAAECTKYNRKDWRHWIDSDRDCQSTRNEVLISESQEPVVFKTGRKCKVQSGRWLDPYTGRIFTNPRRLDIDHVVPLKEAHDSGAWEWTKERKRRFANYLKDEGHLIAVYLSANRKKGAKDPAEWLPANQTFIVEYLRIWTKIKVDWGLTSDKKEIDVLKRYLGDSVKLPVLSPECN